MKRRSNHNHLRSIKVLFITFIIAICVHCPLCANTVELEKPLPKQIEFALKTINKEAAIAHARTLSSSEFNGREAGSKASRRSALYIAEQFRKAKLLPGGSAGSYFRTFKIEGNYKFTSKMQITTANSKLESFKLRENYMPIHLPGGKAKVSAFCVLVGYGISFSPLNFDEYKNIDAKGKVVIVFSGVPWTRKAQAWIKRMPGAVAFNTIAYKVQNAEKNGAVGVLIVDNLIGSRKELKITERLRIPDTRFPLKSSIPVIHITRKLASQLLAMDLSQFRRVAENIVRKNKPQSKNFPSHHFAIDIAVSGKSWVGRNIIGILPGRGEKSKREAVVLGAHYDHLGEGSDDEIYFGANDNASGVSALINIAKAFSSLPKPPIRSIVFVAFDAEEIGLIGSKRYVTSPAIEKIVFMINFDMVGRNKPNHVFAVATRSSPQIHTIHHQMNKYIGLEITNPKGFRLGLSDHTEFYYANIPIMYLFGGLDDDYHSPQDTWDKLIPEKIAKIAQLAFLTAWKVAESIDAIHFNKEEETEE